MTVLSFLIKNLLLFIIILIIYIFNIKCKKFCSIFEQITVKKIKIKKNYIQKYFNLCFLSRKNANIAVLN
tara:strand:- start:331 stop:540 length:210 start_codon:yes stop_codon:yes gene_type:complete